MSLGFWQILIVALLVLVLFGRGKISDLMGDVAKGIKSFKKGMSDDDEEVAEGDLKSIEHGTAEAIQTEKSAAKSKTAKG